MPQHENRLLIHILLMFLHMAAACPARQRWPRPPDPNMFHSNRLFHSIFTSMVSIIVTSVIYFVMDLSPACNLCYNCPFGSAPVTVDEIIITQTQTGPELQFLILFQATFNCSKHTRIEHVIIRTQMPRWHRDRWCHCVSRAMTSPSKSCTKKLAFEIHAAGGLRGNWHSVSWFKSFWALKSSNHSF